MTDEEHSMFDEMMEGLDLEDPGTTTFPESDLDLMREFYRLKNDLNARGALLFPATDEDSDLQGRYFGMVQEMRKRRLM